jgi:translation initiation factor IF-2
MRVPEFYKKVVCSVEVQQVYNISKVVAVAGCIVRGGKITRNTKVHLIRDGIILHDGELASLKRFKEDVQEVSAGFECGISLASYNDLKKGDIIEGYEKI